VPSYIELITPAFLNLIVSSIILIVIIISHIRINITSCNLDCIAFEKWDLSMFTRITNLILNLCDHLNLDGNISRERVRSDCRARVGAALAKDLADDVRASVDDFRLLRVVVRTVDETDELDNPLDLCMGERNYGYSMGGGRKWVPVRQRGGYQACVRRVGRGEIRDTHTGSSVRVR